MQFLKKSFNNEGNRQAQVQVALEILFYRVLYALYTLFLLYSYEEKTLKGIFKLEHIRKWSRSLLRHRDVVCRLLA